MTHSGVATPAPFSGFAAIYVCLALGLAWLVGGQMASGRIDAALAIPLLMPGALLLAWLLKDEAAALRKRINLLAIVALMGIQILFHVWLGQKWGAGQALGTALVGYLCCHAAGVIMRNVRGRTPLHRWSILLLAILLWFGAGQALLWQAYHDRPIGKKPRLTLLTGLPLRWADGGGDLKALLAAGPSDAPALAMLERNFDVQLVDSLDGTSEAVALLVAHPRALAPEDLVRLDRRARSGTRIIILADALSTWPPAYPLGDPRNPPVTSLLTPLLDHWGVTLAAPAADNIDETTFILDPKGFKLSFHSAGRFTRLPTQCRSFGDRRVARCRLTGSSGPGLWIVGDADMLHPSLWQPPLSVAPWLRRSDNMVWLISHLSPGDRTGWFAPIWLR